MDIVQTELTNLLFTALAWVAMVGGALFLAFKSGEIVDIVRDIIKMWRR